MRAPLRVAGPVDLGRTLYVESTRSLVAHRSFGVMAIAAAVAIMVAYVRFFLGALGKDVSAAVIFVVLLGLLLTGFFLVLLRRRTILFDRGLTVPDLRLSELLGPRVTLEFDRITQVELIAGPGDDLGWVLRTEEGRRFTIWESFFAGHVAVHRFLTTALGERVVAARTLSRRG